VNKQTQQLIFTLIKPILGNKYGILLLCVIGLGLYANEYMQRDHYAYAGVPQEQHLSLQTFTRIFRNDGFMLGYSEWRKDPLWVTYHLTPITKKKHFKRPSRFSSDIRSLMRVNHDDYLKSGYDRGHMAPNYAISNLYGKSGQRDTFLMTNITPQRPHLNQKLWQRLEDVEANKFARWFQDVWVITGPVFDEHITTLKSGVEIPDAFFKIYIVPPKHANGTPRVLAFLMPQKVRGNEPLSRFVTTIDNIEQRTGFNFMPQWDATLEHKLESNIHTRGWRLKEVSNLPSRY